MIESHIVLVCVLLVAKQVGDGPAVGKVGLNDDWVGMRQLAVALDYPIMLVHIVTLGGPDGQRSDAHQ